MPIRLLAFILILLGLGASRAATAQSLKATLPPTSFEVAIKAPLFRSAADTLRAPELLLPVGTTVAVVGLWNPHWAIVNHNGYVYMTPVQRLKNFSPAALPKVKADGGPPMLPLDPATKLVTYEGVVEVPGATKDQLYDRALEWMAKTYQSANDVVQIKDKDQGKLLAKGGILYVYNKMPSGYVVHTQTIYVKEGRYKYVMTGFRHQDLYSGAGAHDASMGALEQTAPPKGVRAKAWYDMLTGTHEKVQAMIKDLEQAMQAKGKDPSQF